MKTFQGKLFIVLLFIIIFQILYYYPKLPETVASHFNGAGHPDDWSSKNVFIGIYLTMVIVMIFSFVVLPFGLKRISVSLISLPKKEYWLAPERVEQSMMIIRNQMLLFGNATLIFIIAVMELVIRTNLSGDLHLDSNSMWFLLIAYFVFAAMWLIRFIRRFTNIPYDSARGM